MVYKFDTVNTSIRMTPQRMNVQQFQRVVDGKTTTIKPVQAKVSSENNGSDIVTVTTEKPTPVIQKAKAFLTKANESTIKAANGTTLAKSAHGAKSNSSIVATSKILSPSLSQNRSSQNKENIVKPSHKAAQDNSTRKTGQVTSKRRDSEPKTTASSAGLGLNEQQFLTKVESFLQKKQSDHVIRDALMDVINRAKSRTVHWKRHERESQQDSQSLNYLKCPTSVRNKMLTTPLTRNKFVLDTPILAWDEHYTHEEYLRLAKFHGIFGWQDSNETDIASSLTKLDSPHNRYLFDNRLVNGKIPEDDKCITCAVIGNGGILNGSKKGKEIDANDYVFRVNTALTEGYEEDVGSRTSFYCFGMITLSNTLAGGWKTKFKQLPNDEGIRYVFFADGYWAYTYLASVLHGGKGTVLGNRYPVRFPKKLQANDIKLVHPDFERYLKWSWVNSTYQRNQIHRPTTGGIMLLLALHTCDEVNVYGFGGSYTKFSEHYYDKSYNKHVNYANHDNAAENRLWKKLHDLGIINMYTRG
ncbi:alpha-N-acetylgalactosaminide alpha-2,6-sialyltransferase 2-like [Patiria miniata]|uniref:alpha-N-acetylgalactosaminide alpha-2,6-sialyltransferase n=1 Tax=Patiria miniata TaxID=46514 RepID=A0A914BDB7_PATMI|nr:alpha-N-acetylgalactosaminide alpha-2,6-sialyltransferase 2-like [Patiria miniata]